MTSGTVKAAVRTLRAVIWQCLDQDAFETASFMAERLFAMDPSDLASRHLIGLVYYRLGRYKTVIEYTFNNPHLGCLYLYAKSCFMLREYPSGIVALENGMHLMKKRQQQRSLVETERLIIPTSSMIMCLLGQMYKAASRDKTAILYYGLAAKMDPFCWEAVAGLCKMGVQIKVDTLYANLSKTFKAESDKEDLTLDCSIDVKPCNSRHRKSRRSKEGISLRRVFDTPSESNKDEFTSPSNCLSPLSTSGFNTPTPEVGVCVPRRSSRLASNAKSVGQTGTFAPTRYGLMISPPLMPLSSAPTPGSYNPSSHHSTSGNHEKLRSTKKVKERLEKSDRKAAEQLITELLSTLTTAYVQFCHYKCKEALKTLDKLSVEHQHTPWVLAKQARLQFEMVNYNLSAEYFKKLRAVDRYRQEDMEYYSTLLWHMQKDTDLTFLAYDLVAIDRHSPQAWCAVGNALSLNKDTDQALKCFQRAVYLDPTMPYAYTLQAHEHVANDAYENAEDCYRMALRADKRHYNAWYGLGMVFLRLGNNKMAELHFRKATKINPVNVVLLCCIGMVLEKMNRHEESLFMYSTARIHQPNSALSLYKRARLLVKMGSYAQALADLNKLVPMTPDEASVHFLLGQIHKIMNNRALAVKEFTIALNLDPKGSHLIKEALEGLNDSGIGPSLAHNKNVLRDYKATAG